MDVAVRITRKDLQTNGQTGRWRNIVDQKETVFKELMKRQLTELYSAVSVALKFLE
jgi:hypothetical protein